MAPTRTPRVEAPMRVGQVAELLDVTAATVYRLVRDREIESVRVGRAVRITPAALRRFLGEE